MYGLFSGLNIQSGASLYLGSAPAAARRVSPPPRAPTLAPACFYVPAQGLLYAGPGRPPGKRSGVPKSSKPAASRKRVQNLSDDDFESPEEEFIASDDDFSDMSIEFEELIQSRGGS